MHKWILIFSMLWISHEGLTQANALIHRSVHLESSNQFIPLADGEGYVAAYNWSQIMNTQMINTGIWEDNIQPTVAGDTVYTNAIVVYDENLIPGNTYLFTPFSDPNIYPLSDQKLIIELSVSDHTVSTTGIRGWPPVQNYPADFLSQTGIISYDPPTHTAVGLIDFSAPFGNFSSYTPFSGFFEMVYGNPNRNFKAQNASAVIGDSLVVSYFTLNKNQTLNSTEEFTAAGGQAQFVRTELNLQTQEMVSEQIGSENGSLVNFRVERAQEDGLYRIGLVRGNNTPISVSGAEIPMPDNDSLLHVFITKESASGATEWLTELYAYNNTQADTVLWGSNKFRVQNLFFSILETAESVFLSGELFTQANVDDTLIFRDCFYNTQLYNSNEPYYDLAGGMYQVPMYHSTLYKVDLNGNVIGKLRVASKVSGISGRPSKESGIFEIEGKLAWVLHYAAANDTVLGYEFTGFDGSTEDTFIEFPAGKGVYVLWLDTDLSILDHWIIPYESPVDFDIIDINAILPYQGDTLLIQGSIGRNVTTTLDPFGDSEPFTTPSNARSGFFAFYSAPEIFTSTNDRTERTTFRLYPNPSAGILYVSNIDQSPAAFRIFDLSGRVVLEGGLNARSPIDVSMLNPGMYIFTAISGERNATEKFVVNR